MNYSRMTLHLNLHLRFFIRNADANADAVFLEPSFRLS